MGSSWRPSATAAATMRGREGDIIAGQYRLVQIGNESVVMEYVDGRGRTTIRHVRPGMRGASRSPTGRAFEHGVPVLKHRLVVGIVLALFVSGCAAGRAYRKGAGGVARRRLGRRRRALHEGGPGKPGESGIQDCAGARDAERRRASISAARTISSNTISSTLALLEYKRALELDPSNRLAAAKSRRAGKDHPRPRSKRLVRSRRSHGMREEARRASTPLLSPTAPLPVVSFGPNASVRDILNFIGTLDWHQRHLRSAYQDKAYTVRLEDVTLEQALQQITTANQLFYKVLNPEDDHHRPRQRAEARAVRRSGRARVLHLARGRGGDLADASTRSCESRRCPCSRRCCRTRRPIHRPCGRRRRSMDVIERIIRANDKPRAEVDRRRADPRGQPEADEGSRAEPEQLRAGLTFSPEVAPPNTSANLASPPRESAAVQPEHDLAGHQHGRLLPERADGADQVSRDRLAHQSDREAAVARRRGNEADAEPRRSDSGALDRLWRAGARRSGQRPAVVVQLQGRRRQPRDDAASDLRGRDRARRIHRREQRAWTEHQRRGSGRAVVQLAQSHDEAAAARRRVHAAGRAAARRAAQDPERIPRHDEGANSAIVVRVNAATRSINPTSSCS